MDGVTGCYICDKKVSRDEYEYLRGKTYRIANKNFTFDAAYALDKQSVSNEVDRLKSRSGVPGAIPGYSDDGFGNALLRQNIRACRLTKQAHALLDAVDTLFVNILPEIDSDTYEILQVARFAMKDVSFKLLEAKKVLSCSILSDMDFGLDSVIGD